MPKGNGDYSFPEGETRKSDELPRIRVAGGDLGTATAEAVSQVIAAERKPFEAVYLRGRNLVHIVKIPHARDVNGIQRPVGSLVIEQATPDWMRLYLANRAEWFRPVKVKDKFEDKACNVPVDIARSVLVASPWPEVPFLYGVIEAPIIVPGGRIIQEPGYDAQTGLLFNHGGAKFQTVPENPTREDALKALDVLKEPFAEFPFVVEDDEEEGNESARSVALCSVLTVLVRRYLDSTPMFGFDGPKMGSGKTKLAETASIIATGRPPYTMAQVTDPAEDQKRLISILMEGPPCIVIDNVESALRSSALCTILTEPKFSSRLLGLNASVECDTNVAFMATGNNLVFHGDLSSRVLLCRIDPECEKPEERTFKVNLDEFLPANRERLAVAALTIIKAYYCAGKPERNNVKPYRDYKEWDEMCRAPLVWLGCTDPCKTRDRIVDTDPVRQNLSGLLAAWEAEFDGHATTTATAVARANKKERAIADRHPDELGPDSDPLFEALSSINGAAGGALSSRRIGNFISKHADRFEGGRRFVRVGKKVHHAELWRVEAAQVQATAGELGSYGEFSTATQEKENEKEDEKIVAVEINSRKLPNSHLEDEAVEEGSAQNESQPFDLSEKPVFDGSIIGSEGTVRYDGQVHRCRVAEHIDAYLCRVDILDGHLNGTRVLVNKRSIIAGGAS